MTGASAGGNQLVFQTLTLCWWFDQFKPPVSVSSGLIVSAAALMAGPPAVREVSAGRRSSRQVLFSFEGSPDEEILVFEI